LALGTKYYYSEEYEMGINFLFIAVANTGYFYTMLSLTDKIPDKFQENSYEITNLYSYGLESFSLKLCRRV
jgi:hypothetical protein